VSVARPVVLVTGAASGIGAAAAAELADRGWRVAGMDRRPSHWDLDLTVDVSDPQGVSAAVATTERELGPVTAVVSAAGHYAVAPVEEITEEQWTTMLRVHLGGMLNVVRAVLPGMKRRRAGSIVAVTSELALGGGSEEVHYAAAKGAVIGLVRSLAAEVAGDGVRVNAVAPGPTDTPLLAPDSPWRDPAYLRTLPAGRLTAPEEVALVVAHLVEEATFMTGEIVSPNSGAVI
jgi:2-hydroxycyclohexanecarboxyl-CoA dehydrogenase